MAPGVDRCRRRRKRQRARRCGRCARFRHQGSHPIFGPLVTGILLPVRDHHDHDTRVLGDLSPKMGDGAPHRVEQGRPATWNQHDVFHVRDRDAVIDDIARFVRSIPAQRTAVRPQQGVQMRLPQLKDARPFYVRVWQGRRAVVVRQYPSKPDGPYF